MDLNATSDSLARELDWLSAVIDTSFAHHFHPETNTGERPAPPDLDNDPSLYARRLRDAGLSGPERLILILAMAPLLRPEALDPFLVRNPNTDRLFSEFVPLSLSDGPIVPSVGAALFLIAGEQLLGRLEALRLFDPEAALMRNGLLVPIELFGPDRLRQPVEPMSNFASLVLTGDRHRPGFRGDFPAKRLTTPMSWNDLVLPDQTMHEIGEILAWIEHGNQLLQDPHIGRLIKPGYRSLFYGPSGTGKTLTAALLGQRTDRDVYRVDLSMVVSKWIGETEKNLSRIFDEAEGQGWILFFDEADALFGKRTDVTQSHDRYANQEVSYILQRVEDFDGLIILASNLRSNIDTAFARRFQSMIHFRLPTPDLRLRLWRAAFPIQDMLEDDVDLDALGDGPELAGGAIVNAARYAHLARLRARADRISRNDIRIGIARELQKSGQITGTNE
ncbi:MAG: ATP-binding protein [Pseudomonadota bacterium]